MHFNLYYGSKACGVQDYIGGRGLVSREARLSINLGVPGKLGLAKSVYMKD